MVTLCCSPPALLETKPKGSRHAEAERAVSWCQGSRKKGYVEFEDTTDNAKRRGASLNHPHNQHPSAPGVQQLATHVCSAAVCVRSSKGGRRKGAGGSLKLTRPIICICNDAYAPALRPLRAVAKVILTLHGSHLDWSPPRVFCPRLSAVSERR